MYKFGIKTNKQHPMSNQVSSNKLQNRQLKSSGDEQTMTNDTGVKGEDFNLDYQSKLDDQKLVEKAEVLQLSNQSRIFMYLTFVLFGVSMLWPYNCFLGASAYFQNTVLNPAGRYSKLYQSTMLTVNTSLSMISTILLTNVQRGYTKRVKIGLWTQIFVFSALSAVLTKKSLFGEGLLFTIIMTLFGVVSIGCAINQNGVFALANVCGAEYSQAILIGQAISGVLPSIILFIMSMIGGSNQKSLLFALSYFLLTVVVSVITILMFKFSKINYAVNFIEAHSNASDLKTRHVPFKVLYRKLKYILLAIFTTYSSTLSFPIFALNVFPGGLHMSKIQFTPLVIAIWNLGDFIGRVIVGLPFLNSSNVSPFRIFCYSLIRIGMIPVFFLFNVHNTSKLRGVSLDLVYIFWQIIFGITNGYVATLSYMKVSSQLDDEDERKAASGITTLFLTSGLTLGGVMGYFYTMLVGFY